MHIQADYDAAHRIIVCRLTGPIAQQYASDYADIAKSLSKKYDCKHVLIDIRQVEFKLSTMELHNLPGLLASMGIDRTWKRALVYSGIPEDMRFYEDVATNRGFQVRVFEDEAEAIEWLVG